MIEDRIKKLIRTWRQKSHNEGDQFGSFVFIWFCFNAWLEHLAKNCSTDSKMLNELKERRSNMSELFQAFDVTIANDDYILNSIKKLADLNKEKLIQSKSRKWSIMIIDKNDFGDIIEAIYRIRCNLFHGGKDADDLRDQILVKEAAMILRQWIGKLIESWR